ncbi:MAG: nuclear transport factor 2 family protein [Pseudomonadota bacterium]
MNLDYVLAKEAIRDQLYAYCRSLDRMDKSSAYDLWNEGSIANYHGVYEGTGTGFIDWVWEAHGAMERHSHQISNIIIEVDGDTARSESYVTVALWMAVAEEGKVLEIIARGRYLDTWSRQVGRGGEKRWGIDRREHLVDMQTQTLMDAGEVADASRRDLQDPSFGIFAR